MKEKNIETCCRGELVNRQTFQNSAKLKARKTNLKIFLPTQNFKPPMRAKLTSRQVVLTFIYNADSLPLLVYKQLTAPEVYAAARYASENKNYRMF